MEDTHTTITGPEAVQVLEAALCAAARDTMAEIDAFERRERAARRAELPQVSEERMAAIMERRARRRGRGNVRG